MKYVQRLIIAIMIFSVTACGSKVATVKRDTGKCYTVRGKTYTPLKTVPPGDFQKGVASWYGPGFHGKKTASGEVYDMHSLTAAHNILPLHSWVRVTNLDNGEDVVVKINDRGPFVDDRVIDLSLSAAKKLGMVGPGTVPVRVSVLSVKDAGKATRLASAQEKPRLSRAPNPFYSEKGPRLLALSRN